MKRKILLVSLTVLSGIVLSGCSEEYSDLQQWMTNARNEAKAKVKPVQPPEPIQPVTYFEPQLSGPDSFSQQRMRAAFQNGGMPDMDRPKELLENYSLENLTYVGSIGAKNALSGLIEVPNGHTYTVKPGNHLGQNYGRISRITPDKIEIVEIVEDVSGKWVDRKTELLASPSGSVKSN